MTLYLLDYGAGNVRSLANSLKRLGYDFQWIASPDDFAKATKLIFPGVGAFKSAINHLKSRGLLEPLREYIASGRPYFGICIGLQVLFDSSTENPGVQGLGIIPSTIASFDNADKSVPHMGWNSIDFIDPEERAKEGMDEKLHYYFVHSFRAAYDPSNVAAAQWVHSTTQYGQEIFVASVRRGNVFGTQFHPEKSGEAGLRILSTWLSRSDEELVSEPPRPVVARSPKPRDGLTKRIIACMDVRANDDGDLVVTKGDQYDVREKAAPASSSSAVQVRTAGTVRNLGKPVALAARYFVEGADEICLLNITSFRHSPLQDQPMLAVVRAAAETVFVPLTIGGGIKDTVDPDGTPRSALEVAGEYFRAGADKVSIGSEAVYAVENLLKNGKIDGTSAIETIADAYGRQAVVVSIDPKRVYVDPNTYDGSHKGELVLGEGDEKDQAWWYQCTVSGGRQARDISAVQLAKGAEMLGAGEILLNSIDRDGTGRGFDLDLIRLVRDAVTIPVVASSGAGNVAHFTDVFEKTGVEAALAAGIFHRLQVKIEEVKESLKRAGIQSREISALNAAEFL
ncbi:imidazoleglycerol phosphate synthase [Fomitiporia mediterranea MF3/22]|uniref:imidazoleglycerol phosphate synthase n=1 Tax=Fomitiporia mediterranea (strain MF3/22) TaxID=694068 RepID=UPI0004407EDC|nr:imidazoleglycerol phosphate synthase [Fomitiporia mediterranea MF3/22]EJD04086.1 imidazoleglycerol phosphate synthase [Fomitiporia mediterranea MF3/22]